MSIMADPVGPPYPYPDPLPESAKRAHLDALRAWQRRVNWWNGLMLMPGIVCVIVSIAWGNTRNSGDTPSLWLTNPTLAAGLLYVGMVFVVTAAAAITLLARKKNKHSRLLKAYGIHVDPYTNRITDAPGRARK